MLATTCCGGGGMLQVRGESCGCGSRGIYEFFRLRPLCDITESIQDACEVDVIKTLPIACQKPRSSRPEGPGELCRQPPTGSEELLGIGASWRQTCVASQAGITRCRGHPPERRYLIPETSSPHFLHRKYVPGQSMAFCFQHP